ncbi:caspase family protein [Streptomyces sp. NBC_01142]|uniref:caspase family protein n=1 Tax=Streptomyces sp. NBC_01142 TaxID=2975865 RepID=UPI00224E59E2|nr:caspase family protein [Streptomyces sp. NBC_01142]
MLVGTPYYQDPALENRPVIANNITDLVEVLTDEKLGGFSPFHCLPVPAAASVAQVGNALVRAAEEAEDLLLFYYSGHGQLGPRRRELYLSLAETRHDQLAFTAVPFEAVREACLQSRATSRVVILDCCYSGRVFGDTLAGDDEAVLGEIEVSGAYTLTSAPANRAALALDGERHTAFTGRMLAMLRAGSPAAGTMISLGDIYRHLHTTLRAEGLPLPQRCGVNNADLLGLVRNVQSGHAPGDAPATPGTAEPECVASTDMTQRLTHAERIAHTIGDGLWRTRALTRVALAAANTFDSERLGRLIDQAEQAAITASRTTAEALTAVVTAVAALDPGRAERIAHTAANTVANGDALTALSKMVAVSDPDRAEHIVGSITSTYHKWRALSAIAAAMAPNDPDRAERIANTITDTGSRWVALSAVARAVAASNPDRAEHIANTITDTGSRWVALDAVARTVAASNPDRAEHIANTITNKYLRLKALSAIAAAMAPDNPDRAERIANTITHTGYRRSALSAVAVAARDPERAEHIANEMARKCNRWSARFFAETTLATALREVAAVVAADDPDRAERIANTITHRRTSEGVLAVVARAVAADDPDRAERIANTITHKHTQTTVLIAVASAAAKGDPEHATSLIGQAEQTASMVKLHARTEALTAVATAAAAFDPGRAERIARAISNKPTKESVLTAVAEAVAADDPDRAERIANTISDEYFRVRALASIAKAVAVADPDRARRIAHRVPGQAQAQILHSVVHVLAGQTMVTPFTTPRVRE